MEKYSRMVIDLYKEAIMGRATADKILEVEKELSCALTAARINNEPTEQLQELIEDLHFLPSK